MVKFSRDHFYTILSVFDIFTLLSWPAQIKLQGGGLTELGEFQPGSFSGYFWHFHFMAMWSYPLPQ